MPVTYRYLNTVYSVDKNFSVVTLEYRQSVVPVYYREFLGSI
jgi:hypothetical protein